jgi:hypothetical protein
MSGRKVWEGGFGRKRERGAFTGAGLELGLLCRDRRQSASFCSCFVPNWRLPSRISLAISGCCGDVRRRRRRMRSPDCPTGRLLAFSSKQCIIITIYYITSFITLMSACVQVSRKSSHRESQWCVTPFSQSLLKISAALEISGRAPSSPSDRSNRVAEKET